jgi:hypothetical protein
MSGLPGGAPGLRVYDDLGEMYDAITWALAPVIPGGYTAVTDDAMDDAANAGAARIMDAVPVDPEDGAPIPEQYQHCGAVVTIPSEAAAGDTRGRDQEGCVVTVVIHAMRRNRPTAQTDATRALWRWESAMRARIFASPLLRQYRPRYVGTERGISRTGAEWLTFALTLTLYLYRPGATHNG